MTRKLGNVRMEMQRKLCNNIWKGVGNMNKEEILMRSREQKEDEDVEFIENKGRSYGVVGFGIAFVIIIFFNIFTKQNSFTPYSMFFAFVAAESYGKYKTTKRMSFMTAVVLGASASILMFVCHVMNVLEIGV